MGFLKRSTVGVTWDTTETIVERLNTKERHF